MGEVGLGASVLAPADSSVHALAFTRETHWRPGRGPWERWLAAGGAHRWGRTRCGDKVARCCCVSAQVAGGERVARSWVRLLLPYRRTYGVP